MGRGLSPLQRTILSLAGSRRRFAKRGRLPEGIDVYFGEILVAAYGWRAGGGEQQQTEKEDDLHKVGVSAVSVALEERDLTEQEQERVYTQAVLHKLKERSPQQRRQLSSTLSIRGQHFSRKEIGEKEYNAAVAAVSRALRRLEDRGLVKVIHGEGTGAILTEEGVRVAGPC